MAKRTHERKFPSGLELFLLLVLSGKRNTLYQLQKELAINHGGVLHAVGRLESKGALEGHQEGNRKKRILRVTSAGGSILEENWPKALQESIDNVPDLVRAAVVAVYKARFRSPDSGVGFLLDKAQALDDSAQDSKPPKISPGDYLPDTAEFYFWIKEKAEFNQARAMAATLREVAEVVAAFPELEP